MDQSQLNLIAGFIWRIADDVLRDIYVRGKYRDVVLPMTVISQGKWMMLMNNENEALSVLRPCRMLSEE